MTKRTITCDVRNLYETLRNQNKTTILMNDCEVVEISDGESTWHDIVRQGSVTPIICDGETHTFIQNKDKSWSNVPTEDSGNHEVILTEEQFYLLSAIKPKDETTKTFSVAVTWEVWGRIEVEAKDKDELMQKLKDRDFVENLPLSPELNYVDDSYKIDFDSEIEEL